MNISPKVFEVFYEVVKDRLAWAESYEENYKAALKAAIAQYESEKWQPIETCPKDGSPFLGEGYCNGWESSDYTINPYQMRKAIVLACWDEKLEKVAINGRTTAGSKLNGLTHWMHIPQPPKDI